MKNSLVHLILGLLVVTVFGAAEELAPKVLGVGFPFLLAAVQYAAAKRPVPAFVVFALAAGAFEDALSSLPPMTSASFFLATAALVRWSGLPRTAILLTFPLYQLWLALWIPALGGGIFARILLSIPFGLLTALVTAAILTLLERKAALDELE